MLSRAIIDDEAWGHGATAAEAIAHAAPEIDE